MDVSRLNRGINYAELEKRTADIIKSMKGELITSENMRLFETKLEILFKEFGMEKELRIRPCSASEYSKEVILICGNYFSEYFLSKVMEKYNF